MQAAEVSLAGYVGRPVRAAAAGSLGAYAIQPPTTFTASWDIGT